MQMHTPYNSCKSNPLHVGKVAKCSLKSQFNMEISPSGYRTPILYLFLSIRYCLAAVQTTRHKIYIMQIRIDLCAHETLAQPIQNFVDINHCFMLIIFKCKKMLASNKLLLYIFVCICAYDEIHAGRYINVLIIMIDFCQGQIHIIYECTL